MLTPGSEGMKGAIRRANEIRDSDPAKYFMPGQFDNPANPAVHRRTTAEEIWRDTDGNVDAFVAGVGTGGTITGVGEVLKERKPSITIVTVEPDTSRVLSGGEPGPHKLQGFAPGFIPSILNTSVYSEVIAVSADDAIATARRLAREEGILLGISAGANIFASLQLAARSEFAGKTIVTIGCGYGRTLSLKSGLRRTRDAYRRSRICVGYSGCTDSAIVCKCIYRHRSLSVLAFSSCCNPHDDVSVLATRRFSFFRDQGNLMIRFFLKRPVFATVCSLIILLIGLVAIPSLPIAEYPPIAPPVVTVTSTYTGASAQAVEASVTTPLEEAINGVQGLRYISSTSGNDGTSTITCTFELSTEFRSSNGRRAKCRQLRARGAAERSEANRRYRLEECRFFYYGRRFRFNGPEPRRDLFE